MEKLTAKELGEREVLGSPTGCVPFRAYVATQILCGITANERYHGIPHAMQAQRAVELTDALLKALTNE